jgi:predicted lipoprotein with Yx(FWY)xxD motif
MAGDQAGELTDVDLVQLPTDNLAHGAQSSHIQAPEPVGPSPTYGRQSEEEPSVSRLALGAVVVVTMLVAACSAAVPGSSPSLVPTASPTVSTAPSATVAATGTPATTGSPITGATAQPTPCDDYYDVCNGGGPSSTPSPATGDATITIVSYGPTGDYLAGADRLALYIFDDDNPGSSSCTGNCAGTWPPLTVPMGEEPAAGPGMTGTLDTILRGDGSYQVTYNGMPLYYYADDAALYDTNGDNVGGVWHLARP